MSHIVSKLHSTSVCFKCSALFLVTRVNENVSNLQQGSNRNGTEIERIWSVPKNLCSTPPSGKICMVGFGYVARSARHTYYTRNSPPPVRVDVEGSTWWLTNIKQWRSRSSDGWPNKPVTDEAPLACIHHSCVSLCPRLVAVIVWVHGWIVRPTPFSLTYHP